MGKIMGSLTLLSPGGNMLCFKTYGTPSRKEQIIERWRKDYGSKKFDLCKVEDVLVIEGDKAKKIVKSKTMTPEELEKWHKDNKSNYTGKSKFKKGELQSKVTINRHNYRAKIQNEF